MDDPSRFFTRGGTREPVKKPTSLSLIVTHQQVGSGR